MNAILSSKSGSPRHYRRKNLTKRPYVLVLSAAGIGSQYHTGYEIMQNMKGSGSKDVYRMLKELAPSKYVEDELLLNLSDFYRKTDDGMYKRKFIKKVNRIFNLDWDIGKEENQIENDNRRVIFERGERDRHITILHDTYNAIVIHLDPSKRYGYADLTIFDGLRKVREQEKLIVKSNRKTILALYTIKCLEKTVRYLDIDLSESAKKIISKMQDQLRSEVTPYNEHDMKDNPEILEIKNDRDNWLYRTNFRGFLTFVAHESQQADLVKSNKEIHNLLSTASSEWISNEAQFLDYWQDFERVGFDVVGTLRRIGSEFINQVNDENLDTDSLLTRVTERYYDAVCSFFYWFERSLFITRNKKYVNEYVAHNIGDSLRKYRHETLKRLRADYVRKIQTIDKMNEHQQHF